MEKKMSVLADALMENLKRNLTMQDVYEKKLSELPKGKIRIRAIKGGEYCYLVYRCGKKVCTDYLGVYGKTDLTGIEKQLAARESYKKQIKQLREEEKELRKVIKTLRGSSDVQRYTNSQTNHTDY